MHHHACQPTPPDSCPRRHRARGSLSTIVVEDLVKTYRRGFAGPGTAVRALDGVSLEVRPGESLGIIGPNGAGKTTLLGCLLGFLTPDSGRVTIDGLPPDDLAVRAGTGYLPERLVLDRWMSGLDFLRYHHALARAGAVGRDAECRALLERVGLEPAAGDRRVASYSRGMLQRLGLAQALIGRPQRLFLDEPISGVDPGGVALFRRILSDLRAEGVTLVINSHQLDEVERVCSRVVFVQRGRLEAMDTAVAGAAHARLLRVRLAALARPERAALEALAARAGARFQTWDAPDARFVVDDDAGATRLLAALIEGGVPVVEAVAEEGRLERLFTRPAAPSAT